MTLASDTDRAALRLNTRRPRLRDQAHWLH